MTLRLIMWMVVMACIGFLVAARRSYRPVGVTFTGAVLGAGIGAVLATLFARREQRKKESKGIKALSHSAAAVP